MGVKAQYIGDKLRNMLNFEGSKNSKVSLHFDPPTNFIFCSSWASQSFKEAAASTRISASVKPICVQSICALSFLSVTAVSVKGSSGKPEVSTVWSNQRKYHGEVSG